MNRLRPSLPRPMFPALLLLLTLAGLSAGPAVRDSGAQGATDSTTSAASAPVSTVEESNPSLSLIPLRPQAEISTSVSAARSDASATEAELAPARQRALLSKGRLTIKQEELETTQARMKVAKQSKNAADMASLKLQMLREKREIEYLARTEDAERANVSRIEAERDAANSRVAMFERELELAALRTAQTTTGADSRLTPLVRRALEAMKLAADRGADAASRAKALAERQLTQLKALDRIAAPAR